MQEILQLFDDAISENDLAHVPRAIEALLRLYVGRSASPELRAAVITLLRRKADEATSRAFTHYLRTVADCMENRTPAPEEYAEA